MISLEKSVSTWQFPVNKVIKFGPCWEAPYLWLVTYGQWHYRISSENGGRITKTPALIAAAPFPFPLFRAFLPPPSPSPFCSFMRWKIFQWMELLLGHSSNSRKLSWQKFHNELACVFTAHYASKNVDWNQQQLTNGGILANRNSANHPYCFLSNQKKVQILAFFTCDPTKKCIMPSSRERHKRDNRERAWSQARVVQFWRAFWRGDIQHLKYLRIVSFAC